MRTLALGLSRTRYELRLYFRQGDAVFFTFLFPIVLLCIFSVAFSTLPNVGAAPDGSGGISYAAFYLPGMLAAGMLLSGLQNLAVDIAGEKGDGTLKRLAGTPLPMFSYFLGKIGMVLASSIWQAILLLLVARFAFDVALPSGPGAWWTFAWVFMLGVMTSCVLGIALSALPRSGKSATAVIVPLVLVLQFISGVYLSFAQLPGWLQNVASLFPLKWMAQGMRSVFLPATFESMEPTGAWELGTVAWVLGLWFIAGLVVCRLTFRWIRKDS